MDVDSSGVVFEVLIDGVGNLDGTVGKNFLLDGLNVVGNSIGGGSVVLVLAVGEGITGLALAFAGVGGVQVSLASVVGSVVVVVLASKGHFSYKKFNMYLRRVRIGLASGLASVVTSSDESFRDPVFPGLNGVSSFTSISASNTTAEIEGYINFEEVNYQARISSVEILTCCCPLLAMQIRSLMASAAPKAQQDPQADWSRMKLMEGHWGHWVRASNESGMTSSEMCSLVRAVRRSSSGTSIILTPMRRLLILSG